MTEQAPSHTAPRHRAGPVGPAPLPILLLEPDDGFALLASAALRVGVGPHVAITRATDLAEAQRLLSTTRPACALVAVSDSTAETLDAVRWLIERDPLLSIIVLTEGVAERDRGVEAVRAGAQDYLSKVDLTPQVLGRMIRYAIERSDFHRRLRASEQVLARAMEHSPIGWSILSPQGNYVKVNPTFAALLGRSAEQLVGAHFDHCTHPDDRPAGERALRQLLSGARSDLRTEKRYLRPDGQLVWALVNVIAVR